MIEIPDVHNSKPLYPLKIRRAGISNVPVPPFEDQGCWIIPRLSVFVDLPQTARGVHMSRIYKALYNELKKATALDFNLLEKIGKTVLMINEYANLVDLILKAGVVIEEQDREYTGLDWISARLAMSREGVMLRESTASLLTVVACPCALEVSRAVYSEPYTHNSKIRVTTTIKSSRGSVPALAMIRELSSVLNKPRNYMSRLDEARFIKGMVESPLFAEDVARLVAQAIVNKYSNQLEAEDEVAVRINSVEPLHEYNIYVLLKLKVKEVLNALSRGS
ncbi:MAG: GTP cyclohydrolase, FolE2/MptA family [Desulfurococcaceae archaeon]